MQDKLDKIISEYKSIQEQFLDPETSSDPDKLKELGKKNAKIEDIAKKAIRYTDLLNQKAEALEMLEDPEMKELAKEEIASFEKEIESLEKTLTSELSPKDPRDPKNIILEVRAGAGGEEASLFGAELARMYFRFAEKNEWEVEIISKNESENGGIKEIVAEISGKNVFKIFKFESGVHRVQRIPKTESQGRIHTSTCTVAVIPEADEEEEIEIRKEDVRVDTYRASGAGGQHVNKTESAIRLTHIPSGLVVTCQDEKSQHKNRDRAFKVLKSRLIALAEEKRIEEGSEERLAQIGTGDRSEKIRTYNFPQDRITDHRIKKSFPNIPVVLDGEIDNILESCALYNDEQSKS